MKAIRIEATVAGDGSLTIQDLPFSAGQVVEVIVLPHETHEPPNDERYPLRGSVLRYDRPFDPAVDPDDWEAV